MLKTVWDQWFEIFYPISYIKWIVYVFNEIIIHWKFIFNKEIYVLNNKTSIDSIFVIPSHKIYICFSKIKVKWENSNYSILGIFLFRNILNWWTYKLLILKLWSEENNKKDNNY